MMLAEERPGAENPGPRRSEAHSQSKLDYAWQVVLGSNRAKVGRSKTRARRIELRSIEDVEEFRPEFEVESVIRAELGVFVRRNIEVLDPVGANVWFCSSVVAVAIIVGEGIR